ncbi:hypothetical protein R1flu_007145 [Riccia fluitans]|uniref:Endonuclease/exonuclease/phosphatase domain-containing protein n=1 Tax=Riccia fluitans TaxID=41844 RepID=A0ABD1YY20_9MARC
MVETSVDSVGPSPVLRGEELRSWNLCVNVGDFRDTWHLAVGTRGALYTRQPWHNRRFDQARLDRIYISGRGQWAQHVSLVRHYSQRVLSDHTPVSATLVYKQPKTRKITSYFKMDPIMMTQPGAKETIERIWNEHPQWAKDGRKKWFLAWGRVGKALREIRKNRDEELPEVQKLREQGKGGEC